MPWLGLGLNPNPNPDPKQGLHVLPMELHWLPEAEERLDRLLSPLLGRIAACSAAGIHESQRTPHGQACRA